MPMINGLSQMDRAMNDTLVSKADDEWFDKLCSMYGLPRIPYIQRKYWRKAVLAANFAKRDGLGTVFTFCREALRGQDSTRPVVLQVPSDPLNADRWRLYRYTLSGGGPGFSAEEQFRLWEIEGMVYLSGVRGPETGGYSEYIEMNRYKSPHWSGFDGAKLGVPGDITYVAATLLPFHLRGAGGKAELILEEQDTVPPTYLQKFYSAVDPQVSTNVLATPKVFRRYVTDSGTILGVSFVSHQTLQASYKGSLQYVDTIGSLEVIGLDADAPVPSSGTFSVNVPNGGDTSTYSYLSTGYNSAEGYWLLNSVQLLSGPGLIFADGQIIKIDLPDNRGGDYQMSLKVNNVVALTLTLADGVPGVLDSTTEIPVQKGDQLSFEAYAAVGTPPSVPLLDAHMTAFMERPAGQPLGGELMAEATADQPGTGPWPLYLEAGQAKDWRDMLDRMVALGVEPVARTSIHLNSD